MNASQRFGGRSPRWSRRGFLTGALAAATAVRARGARPADVAGPAPGGVSVLVFDVFGTVVDWRSGLIAEAGRIGRARGIAVDGPALADAWAKSYQPAMDRVRSGELPWTKLEGLLRSVAGDLLVRFGLGDLSVKEKEDFVHAWRRLPPWPDAVEGLTRLRRRRVIAPLSNANVALLTHMARAAGLPWDCILSAELVRRYKPAPEVYRMVPEMFDVKPSEVMMVAAHEGGFCCGRRGRW